MRNDFLPIVSAKEMARLEALAIAAGANEKHFMQEAGKKVAARVEKHLRDNDLEEVVLLVGSGNNGGDAWVAGIELLRQNFQVRALQLSPLASSSPLNQLFGHAFLEAGGIVSPIEASHLQFTKTEVIVDGLLGTGFHGKTEGLLALAMKHVNASSNYVFAIDIPSGLNGSTGEVEGEAIKASETICLGLPKSGFFLENGWNFVGRLHIENFGLAPEIIEEAKPFGWMPKTERLHLPPILRNWHKYQRGFVVGFGGSKELKGALKLSGRAALHAGAGFVKLFSLEEIGEIQDELIFSLFEKKTWREGLKKAKSVFIGPGLGRSKKAGAWLRNELPSIDLPCVIDGDALHFLTALKRWPKNSLLTPHLGELHSLIGKRDSFSEIQAFVEEKKVILVRKGAPTFIFSPQALPFVISQGDPGMATAGAGDVLTGIIAALLAQAMMPLEAAILGATLHGMAGEIAALRYTSRGYTASALIESLSTAFSKIPM
jgi:hydroxyethylthiazole kinase-like uncharacterized protein yjeF